MEMVGHEAETVNLPIGFGAGLAQGVQKQLGVVVVAKDDFGMVAAIHHVVDRPRILDTRFASHEQVLTEFGRSHKSPPRVYRRTNGVKKWRV
jgi:hypothetical protein